MLATSDDFCSHGKVASLLKAVHLADSVSGITPDLYVPPSSCLEYAEVPLKHLVCLCSEHKVGVAADRVFGILREHNPELTGEKRRTIMKPPQVQSW